MLVCPLDWGIGHATRCVPVVMELLNFGNNVIIGASGRSLAFLKNEFPKLNFLEFPGYNVKYSKKGSLAVKMLLASPAILMNIFNEHKKLQGIIDEYNIDLVVSDNRYGLFTKKVPCVFMTHQLNIKTPGHLSIFQPLLQKLNSFSISKNN